MQMDIMIEIEVNFLQAPVYSMVKQEKFCGVGLNIFIKVQNEPGSPGIILLFFRSLHQPGNAYDAKPVLH